MLAVARQLPPVHWGVMAKSPTRDLPPMPPADEARVFGRALKALRERQGLTQQEAADRMGVTKTAWQNYEAGRPVILRTDMQARLTEALGLDRSELVFQAVALTPPDSRPALSSGPEPTGRAPGVAQAVFPLREGPVTLSFPTELSAESFAQLEAYLTTFLSARRPTH